VNLLLSSGLAEEDQVMSAHLEPIAWPVVVQDPETIASTSRRPAAQRYWCRGFFAPWRMSRFGTGSTTFCFRDRVVRTNAASGADKKT